MGRRFGNFCLLLATVCCAWLASHPARAATVAYWRFENNVQDATANNNHATATGTAFSTDLFGATVPQTAAANSRSLQFNNTPGTGNAAHYLRVPHSTSLNIATGSFTIEAFVRMDIQGSDPLREYIVMKKDVGQADSVASYAFLAKAGDLAPVGPNQAVLALTLSNNGASQSVILSDLLIPDFDWHHVSVALDHTTGNVRFTLDDQVDLKLGAATGITRINNTQPLYIGAHPTSSAVNPPNHGYDGRMDEVRISNTFLPTSQLMAVPEPASWSLLAAGTFAVVCWWRCGPARRRRHAAQSS